MIKKLFISSITVMSALVIFADANRLKQTTKPPYDKSSPPPISIVDAYALALKTLAAETNQYYCVNATCLNPLPDRINTGDDHDGWLFLFSNTNSIEKRVAVYFDGQATVISRQGAFGQ